MMLIALLVFSLVCGVVGGQLVEWLIGWRVKRGFQERYDALMRDFREGKELPPRKPTSPISIASNAEAVVRSDKRSANTLQMAWNDIARVTAFKRDLMTVDCVCMLLADADGHILEVDEEMAGWQELCEALPQRLPGAKPFHEWFMQVAFPAFATNGTDIFRRP